MDTDVEVIKPIDDLLKYEAVSGFESETQIPTGLMACERGHRMFKQFLDDYNGIHFVRNDGSFDITTNVKRITARCMKYGLKQDNTMQTLNGFTLLPKDFLCPKDSETKELFITDNTLVIHHFDGSWMTDELKYAYILKKKLEGIPASSYIAKFISITKYRGFPKAMAELFGWLRRKKRD